MASQAGHGLPDTGVRQGIFGVLLVFIAFLILGLFYN
jgi:hypothetical protein